MKKTDFLPVSTSTQAKNKTSKALPHLKSKQFPCNLDESSKSSLGLLSLDGDFDNIQTDPLCAGKINRISSINPELQQQRLLAQNSLRRISDNSFRNSEYTNFVSKTPGRFESTVNESDLLRQTRSSVFNPELSSTPRPSADIDASLEQAKATASRLSNTFQEFIHKLTTTDIDLAEACRGMQDRLSSLSSVHNDADNSTQFTPAELAQEKLLADELAWRKEKDIPAQNVEFSTAEEESFEDIKMSMGEFFQQKSDDLQNIMPNHSPEKVYQPIPLINDTTEFVSNNDMTEPFPKDSLSVSEIAKVLSELNVEEIPASGAISYFMKCMKQESRSNSDKENLQPNETKEGLYCDPTQSEVSENSKDTLLHYIAPSSSNKSESSGDGKESLSRYMEPSKYQESSADKSISSLRSGSSLSNLPNGKLPIESSKSELIWACTKVGKNSIKEVVVRNRSQSRLHIQVALCGSEFRMVKNRYDTESRGILRLILRPYESRAISVSFAPHKVGAAVGLLNFTPADPELQQTKKQFIKLFGYGGHASIDVSDVLKDTTGKLWISLGDMEQNAILKKQFTIKNSGTIAGFVNIFFTPKALFSHSSVTILPEKFIVKPSETVQVELSYTANKQDVMYFRKTAVTDIVELGTLKLCSGEEALRGRLNRLTKKAEQNNLEVKPLAQDLCKIFKNEMIPEDVRNMKESLSSARELFQELQFKEIMLTSEHDSDKTLVSEESSIFQTLCHDASNITVIDMLKESCFKVEPTTVILTPPSKTEDTLLVTCTSKSDITFEVSVVPNNQITVASKTRCINSGDTIPVKVACKNGFNQNQNFKVIFTAGGDRVEITVKVVLLNSYK